MQVVKRILKGIETNDGLPVSCGTLDHLTGAKNNEELRGLSIRIFVLPYIVSDIAILDTYLVSLIGEQQMIFDERQKWITFPCVDIAHEMTVDFMDWAALEVHTAEAWIEVFKSPPDLVEVP